MFCGDNRYRKYIIVVIITSSLQVSTMRTSLLYDTYHGQKTSKKIPFFHDTVGVVWRAWIWSRCCRKTKVSLSIWMHRISSVYFSRRAWVPTALAHSTESYTNGWVGVLVITDTSHGGNTRVTYRTMRAQRRQSKGALPVFAKANFPRACAAS
jgi:hypothetical protein